MLSVSGADHIITMDLHASQIQVSDVNQTKKEVHHAFLLLVCVLEFLSLWSAYLTHLHLELWKTCFRNLICVGVFWFVCLLKSNADKISSPVIDHPFCIPGIL